MLHQAVREGWPGVLAACEGRGGLPKRVHEEVRRYLGCGDVRRGFTLVRCERCAQSEVVAFSCKSRGWCPSCAARRAHEASAHLEAVLPAVAYRQWTLSLPHALRWLVVKDAKLLRAVERFLARAIFRWQRRRAKELGVGGTPKCGAVCFTQLFNSHLALQPHLHLLAAQGVWCQGRFVALPPPDEDELQSVLARLLQRLRKLFEGLEAGWPEDGFEALQLEGAQLRLQLPEQPRPRRGRLVAVGQGFSLHAATWVHANDSQGLARLTRYGARGPIAESRLSRRDDGQYAYQTKRGVTLVLTAQQLVKRLLWLVPPARLHLTNFHGVFASHSSARAGLLPSATPHADTQKQAAAQLELAAGMASPVAAKRPRLDWASLHARTWATDVWTCHCGGKRSVLALVTSRTTAEDLLRKLGLLPPRRAPVPLAQAPPQFMLSL